MIFKKVYSSMVEGVNIDDPATDYKNSKRISQFHYSDRAVYKPDGTYLPFCAVKEIIHDQTMMNVKGCCGAGVMMERLIYVTESGKFVFLFDRKKEVEQALEVFTLA